MTPEQAKSVLIATIVVFILILLWAVSIGITYWDAAARRKLPGIEIAAWVALVIFIPGIGFAAYIFARLLGNVLSPNPPGFERPRRVTNLKRQIQPQQRTGTIPAAEFLQSAANPTFPEPKSSTGMMGRTRKYIIYIIAGPNSGEEYILDYFPVRIGRGFDVFISLDDDRGVSRQHAEIYQQTGVLRIRDLNSTHGTKVNDFSITDKSLDTGDQIQVGMSILKVGVQKIRMMSIPPEEAWRLRLMGSNLPWGSRPDRPADVGDELCAALLARENILEDANYQKIAPNQFVIEIGMENYSRNFHLLKDQILQQWNEKLLTHLLTANSRQGRQEYRFAGPLKIEIHPVEDLGSNQIRILSRVMIAAEFDFQSTSLPGISACLESLPERRRWNLRPGISTIGRDPSCDLYLDNPTIQRTKLVSSQHAYLYCKSSNVRLYDGSPNGQPSLNGTFVNLQRLPPNGIELKNGDLILLAALNVNRPNPDTHGVASFRFFQDC